MTREQIEEIARNTPRTYAGILAALERVAAEPDAEVLRVLEPFARVWNTRGAFDETQTFRVECEIGQHGAFADAAALHARLIARREVPA